QRPRPPPAPPSSPTRRSSDLVSIGRDWRITAERVDGDQNERRRRDHSDREDAATGTVRGVTESEAPDRTPAVTTERRVQRPAQADGNSAQTGDEQRGPCAEERSRAGDRTGQADAHQRRAEQPEANRSDQ